ncbi:unnamed protein product [Closterium sp. Naga37s-1]|nr:unnamed protein product [Closterium sp. Naga37s-1]
MDARQSTLMRASQRGCAPVNARAGASVDDPAAPHHTLSMSIAPLQSSLFLSHIAACSTPYPPQVSAKLHPLNVPGAARVNVRSARVNAFLLGSTPFCSGQRRSAAVKAASKDKYPSNPPLLSAPHPRVSHAFALHVCSSAHQHTQLLGTVPGSFDACADLPPACADDAAAFADDMAAFTDEYHHPSPQPPLPLILSSSIIISPTHCSCHPTCSHHTQGFPQVSGCSGRACSGRACSELAGSRALFGCTDRLPRASPKRSDEYLRSSLSASAFSCFCNVSLSSTARRSSCTPQGSPGTLAVLCSPLHAASAERTVTMIGGPLRGPPLNSKLLRGLSLPLSDRGAAVCQVSQQASHLTLT